MTCRQLRVSPLALGIAVAAQVAFVSIAAGAPADEMEAPTATADESSEPGAALQRVAAGRAVLAVSLGLPHARSSPARQHADTRGHPGAVVSSHSPGARRALVGPQRESSAGGARTSTRTRHPPVPGPPILLGRPAGPAVVVRGQPRQVSVSVSTPLAGTVTVRFAPLSHVTVPDASLRTYLYCTVVPAGSVTDARHTG